MGDKLQVVKPQVLFDQIYTKVLQGLCSGSFKFDIN